MMNAKKKIVFIVNPRAGVGRYKKADCLISKTIDAAKYDYQIKTTQHKNHGRELALQAVKEGVDVVVAVGGDGTINEVASALIGTDVALGLISTGSGNGLAHHLKIPISIKKAIKVLNEGNSKQVDTLEVNNDVCLSVSGIGFDGMVAEMFDVLSQRGLWAYVWCVVKTFFTYKSQTYIFEDEKGKQQSYTAMLVSLANSSQWGFNVKIAPKASITDGYVDVCFLKKPNFFTLFFRAIALFSGELQKYKKAAYFFRTSECKIYVENNIPQPFHIDGDPKERQTQVHLKVIPKSLKVILPCK